MSSLRGAAVGVVIPAASCPCTQIKCVLAQLGANDRLVVVWNSDTPRSGCCIDSAQRDAVVWIVADRQLGAGSARNIGAAALPETSAIIAFCDADDAVQRNWLEALTSPIRSGAADVVGGALSVRKSATAAPVHVSPESDFWHRQALFGSNLALHRRAWKLVGGFDETLLCCEDTDLAWRAGAAGLRVEVSHDALVALEPRGHLGEFVQRVRWGFWSQRLLRNHKLGASHIPTLREIHVDVMRRGYARNTTLASIALWIGLRSGTIFGKQKLPPMASTE